MNDQRIAIVTDSGTDTPAEFCVEHDVRVVPLTINYADGSYRAGIDITSAEVVKRFAQETPTTSLPTPEEIRTCFEDARAAGYERAVFVSLSSGLSATNQTVHLVASQLEDFPVLIIDSKSIGVAAGMVVMAAAEMVEEGIPFEELEGRLVPLAKQTDVFFCCRELEHLRKGGRISEPTYRMGSVLNIKPIITCNPEGRYVPCKKARGWEKAMDSMVGLIAGCAAKFPKAVIAICCSEAEDDFDLLEAKAKERIPNMTRIIRSSFSPALMVHTGPRVVGMGVQPARD
jgi:DegV family protein with EDD domain